MYLYTANVCTRNEYTTSLELSKIEVRTNKMLKLSFSSHTYTSTHTDPSQACSRRRVHVTLIIPYIAHV